MAKPKTKLTPADEQLLTAIENGQTYEDLATHYEVEPDVLRTRVGQALNRTDKDELLRRFPIVYMQVKGVEGLDPTKDVIKMSKEIGVPKPLTDALRRRILARQGGQDALPAPLTDRELVQTLKGKLALSLQYLDPYVLAGSTSKELMGVIDDTIKNIQLLEGKPTSITSHEDRRKFNELLPLVIQEAKRRGLVIDVVSERIEPGGEA